MLDSEKHSLKSIALVVTTQMESIIKTSEETKTWRNEIINKRKHEEIKKP